MTNRLIRRFVREAEDVHNPRVRGEYGKLAGVAGIAANALLFFGKLLAGALSGSVAMIADAFNNLSDAGSSVVTLVGFRLSAAPPDKEHPFGHGRVEYLSALTVAALIMLAGVELASSAVSKIVTPDPVAFSWISTAILVASIAVKAWMAHFNHTIGKKIRSEALAASAADSRNDVICTAVVLLSSVFARITGMNIDGWVGAAVALFVIWSGFSVVRETVSPLLGEAPDPLLVEDIRERVLSQEGIIGIHDLIVHNYGPGRCIVSLHAEVPSDGDILKSHEIIDAVERRLAEELNLIACIHMDPVDTKDERVSSLRILTNEILQEIDPALSLHDFRVVFGEQRSNVIFDVVVPFSVDNVSVLQPEIERRLQEVDPHLYAVVTIDREWS
ncbi:MAG: cation transporter [Clostridia bacterium]|nr:cation transporter [Clostridia bacterium]